MQKRVVLAYSGGLDTSVAIRWLAEQGYEVIAATVDVWEQKKLDAIAQKALQVGAKDAYVIDAKQEFCEEFLLPAIAANALYQGRYPLATALARPLIAKHLCRIADETGAEAISHGCTGKGNDQVRFDVAIETLRPGTRVIAPAREWGLTREEEIAYAQQHGIPVEATVKSPFSVDANLWGRSVEGGVLEDPWQAPPEECYAWTKSPALASSEELVVSFESGVPVALGGEQLPLPQLIAQAAQVAGSAGVGRIDLLEDRLVGIKSREIYEAPAAVALIGAHQEVEFLTLPRELLQHKTSVEQAFAQVVYNGQWFSPLRAALFAYLQETQKAVTGEVRLLLEKGRAVATGRRSPQAVYDQSLATYSAGDTFDHSAAVGFITIYGMQSQAYAKAQSKAKAAAHAG